MCIYIGLDIGKAEIHYHYLPEGKAVSGKFANTKEAIAAFIDKLPPDAQAIMEATGSYHFPLCFALQDARVAFTVLNPAVSAGYARSLNSTAKTDKADSAMLSRFGRERNPPPSRLESGEWYAFRLLIDRWEDLKVRRQAIENQSGGLQFYPQIHPLVAEQLQQDLLLIDRQITAICERIEKELPPDYEQMVGLAGSVKGIGKKTATHLTFLTKGLKQFSNHRQLAKYIGIAPNVYQSGRTVRKGIICRQGAPLLRSLLYNCAKSAKRYNAACKELYDRLRAKGKPHKVAMVAVMHKLVRQVFAVVKSGKAYADDYRTATPAT